MRALQTKAASTARLETILIVLYQMFCVEARCLHTRRRESTNKKLLRMSKYGVYCINQL